MNESIESYKNKAKDSNSLGHIITLRPPDASTLNYNMTRKTYRISYLIKM